MFAPQCLSTLAVVKRETNSWRYPLIMAAYLFALAYVASFITYRVTLALGRLTTWSRPSSSPLLVVVCSLHAAWTLAPAAARRAIARALLAWPLPARAGAPLRRHAQAASGGCALRRLRAGAGQPNAARRDSPAPRSAPITVHRRLPR